MDKNVLSNRSHCTRVGNAESETLPLLSGVIWGSGIGLILFVMYVNELAKLFLLSRVRFGLNL